MFSIHAVLYVGPSILLIIGLTLNLVGSFDVRSFSVETLCVLMSKYRTGHVGSSFLKRDIMVGDSPADRAVFVHSLFSLRYCTRYSSTFEDRYKDASRK